MAKKSDYEVVLASHWGQKWRESMLAKMPYTTKWDDFFDAYRGEYFKKKSMPDYKSNLVSNYVFSIIETIRPIMVDNDPKFQCMPRNPQGLGFAEDMNKAMSYEWDREHMNVKLFRELVNILVTGSSIFFVRWDKETKQIKGQPVNPYNFFPDPLARDIQSAEYVIYADYYNVEALKRSFPAKADQLQGGSVKHQELMQEIESGNAVDNQVLVLEVYHKNSTLPFPDGDERSYKNGRITTVCPDLGIVLDDKPNPYDDGLYPFVMVKDYDMPGQFWGEGEVAQLISPQTHMNELNNAIIDNAKTSANMPWIVDKTAGIPEGSITSRPGLILRKNQGSEVRREQPPSMPAYIINATESLKADMEQVSGIFDTLKGNSATGVYTAQGILALQEAGQARIRLKVKILEEALGDIGRMWVSRMRQFWKGERWTLITASDGTLDLKKVNKEMLENEYDIKIMAGSTMAMNRNAMLDLMIRLAQTQMPDGQALVDREAVVEFLPQEVKTALLRRAEAGGNAFQEQINQLGQAVQEQQQGMQQLAQQQQQIVQETRQADQQTMGVLKNLADSVQRINEKLGLMEQEGQLKQQQEQTKQREQELEDSAYNRGYADAEAMSGDPLGEGLEDTDAFSEGEADMALPEDMMQGLESLSPEELSYLQMTDPTVANLLR